MACGLRVLRRVKRCPSLLVFLGRHALIRASQSARDSIQQAIKTKPRRSRRPANAIEP